MGSAYESVNWETDQRPDWWISHTLIWEFRLPTETTFATSSLEDAAYRLANRLRRPLEEARRAVFTGIPLEPGQQATLTLDGTAVACHWRRPYLRTQVARLAQLQAFLDAFREGVISDVLVDFTNASERGEADALMDESDRTHYLGVNARTLKQWALEYQAYEVTDFLKHYRKPEAASQAVEAVVADPDDGHLALVKKHSFDITRFGNYFDAADFTPLNDHEATALAIHKQMRGAPSAAEEQRLLRERDTYLIKHVF